MHRCTYVCCNVVYTRIYNLYFKVEKNTGPEVKINVLIRPFVVELANNCIYNTNLVP